MGETENIVEIFDQANVRLPVRHDTATIVRQCRRVT